ncbi:MAG TPA: hypothetical protein ENJ37_06225 [Deltaproteobacteria bacterium]|nr:hypothetical protein [Deltaproteobacteria bacterium]
MKRLVVATLAAVAVGLFAAGPSMALHKNFDNKLTCGNCHTMHNSQGNSEIGGTTGTGALVLLRGNVSGRQEIHNFCLQCHASNGAQAGDTFNNNHPAPKVYIDGSDGGGIGGTGVDFKSTGDFGQIGAGGDFSGELTGNSSGWSVRTDRGQNNIARGFGHSLGATNVLPPGSADGNLAAFSCTSCHDPHGAYDADTSTVDKYRNLRKTPTGSGSTSVNVNDNTTSWIGMGGQSSAAFANAVMIGTDKTTAIWPVYDSDNTLVGDGGTADQAISNYYPVNSGDSISNWCATCHDNWHEDIATTNDTGSGDWRRHPVDEIIYAPGNANQKSGAGVDIINLSNYTQALIAAGKALPVANNASDGSGVYYLDPASYNSTDRVFCLSCHFAHGGPYYDNLRWDYLSEVWPGGSAGQSGNSIASTVGCQLCHNR